MFDALQVRITALKQTYLPADSLRERFAKGAFWSLAGTIISRGLNLLSSIIVARFLGKVGFGELGMLQSTVGMFGVFAGLGLGMTATKYVAEFREKDKSKTGRIIALSSQVAFITGGLTTLVLLIIAPWLATKTLSASHLANPLRIAVGLLFFGAINGAQTGALAGFEAFKTIAQINLIAGLISFPIVVVGVKLGGLNGVVWGLVISMVFNYLLNHFAIKRECEKNGIIVDYQNSRQEVSVLWKFSVPAFLSSAMVGPVTWLCNTMLVNQPNGYAEMGIFNAANQWRNALLYIPGVLTMPAITLMSNAIGLNQVSITQKVYIKTTLLNGIILLPAVILLSLWSPQIMSAYGSGFSSGWSVMILMLVVTLLLGIMNPTGNLITATGKMWLGFLMNSGWAIVLILSTYYLVHLGAKGLALAYLIAYGVHTSWTFGYAYYYFYNKNNLI
jgi:O-antigen/teichoic acid export membrane protein